MEVSVLKALFEPKRYLLLQLMSERSYCVRALARKSGLTDSAVSQHLKVLKDADLVYGKKRGYYTHYGLNKDKLADVIAELTKLGTTKRKPCEGPYYGCSESEYLRCKAYVPPEKRGKD